MRLPWLLSAARRTQGQGLTEYALILGAIAVLVTAAMVFFNDALMDLFADVGALFRDVVTP